MPEISINNQTVQVPEGTNLIQAARKVGIDIPHFCYHPGLSVAGSCRMCQVEIEVGGRKRIDLACTNSAADGMSVRTNTPEVQKAVRGVLEFLLMNHPLDCPICDDAGECKLQNYFLIYGLYDSRLSVEKWHKPKVQPVGPQVMLDDERCVLCGRCVRFCDEIWGERQLGIFGHGSNEILAAYPGKALDNPYSVNVVDLCPVGALTQRDFRFKRRVWYLQSAKTVCPLCSRGCNTYLHFDLDHDYKAPGVRVLRVKPRVSDVNRWWICDQGRLGYKFIDDPQRAKLPAISGRSVGWEEALGKAEELIRSSIKRSGANAALLIAPHASNEDAYVALRLFRDHLKFGNVDYDLPTAEQPTADYLLRTDDPYPNRRGFEDLGFKEARHGFKAEELADAIRDGKVKGLVAAGVDFPALWGGEAEALISKLDWLIHVAEQQDSIWQKATVALPQAVYAERCGTFSNFKGKVQKFEKAFEALGVALPQWQIWQKLATRLGAKWSFEDERKVFQSLAAGKPAYETLNWRETCGIERGMSADNW